MKQFHVLMVERDKEGNPTAAHEVPNNEWAKARRRGLEFATPEERAEYEAYLIEQRSKANAPDEDAPEPEAEAEPDKPARGGRKPAAKE